MLRTAQSPPPRFDAGLSTDTGGFATGDLGVSPDRTLTGWLPQACRPITSCHQEPSPSNRGVRPTGRTPGPLRRDPGHSPAIPSRPLRFPHLPLEVTTVRARLRGDLRRVHQAARRLAVGARRRRSAAAPTVRRSRKRDSATLSGSRRSQLTVVQVDGHGVRYSCAMESSIAVGRHLG
jgi:hypothetical protein